ncbi:MAG: efflux RND transporter periplasmic adaptor subunit [Bacteroidia bacterium]|nr:efflux RND transporter periplasmic adaptor subunit [Bacteroidia bacterium]
MKSIKLLSLATAIALSACGGKKDNLSQKRAELEKLKSEIAKLQTQAKKLENEIAVLDPKKESGKLVETENAAVGLFNSYLNINGKADADESTIATAQVPSTVTSVLVKPGDRVGKGQALAYLDNATLKQSRAQIESQLAFANTLFLKQKRLWEQGVGTEVQFLSAKNQKDALEKNLATLDAQIAMYIVKSPISGTVESVDTKIGQIASPGMPLFKVVNLSNLKVVADVAESYSSKIKTGDKVFVSFPDIAKKVEAKITFASKLIDPLNRTFHVEISLPQTEGIKPNMIANLQIVDYTNSKAIAVPTNCIQTAEDQKYVVIVTTENGKTFAKRATVSTGHTGDERTEILSGINIGDQIVVNGYQELIDGQQITLAAPAEEPKK